MPVLSEDSVLIMDGTVKLYRRERSRKWQAAFQIDGQYIRISTGKSDLDEAKQAARIKTKSLAKYPVATKPVLRTLHEHLLAWDAKHQNPTAHDSELADIAGISVNAVVNGETIAELQAEYLPTRDLERVIKRRKQLAVQRHLRIAEQYIANVALEEFPKRKAR